ncbi:hypothetical protein CICLE_v100178221mg, partial [Citrus x clementina]
HWFLILATNPSPELCCTMLSLRTIICIAFAA